MRATLVVAVLVVVYPGVAFAQLAPQSQAEFEQRFKEAGTLAGHRDVLGFRQ